jgi:uncharacterized protein YggE
MNHAPVRPIRCGSISPAFVVFAVLMYSATFAHAQADQQQPGFWVTSAAEVHVKPDQAIVYMAIRCSSSATTDALADCDHKMQVIQQALEGIDLKGKYRFSEDHFGSVRVTYPPQPYQSNQPPLMEISRYIFVTFEAADMADPHFDQKLAVVIDVLMKSGAVQADTQIQPVNLPGGGSVIYTLKNPELAFLEASRKAAERAKSLAQETAQGMGVTTKGIVDVRITRPFVPQQIVGPNNALNPLNELHLEVSSYVKDDVTVQATVTAGYSIQH